MALYTSEYTGAEIDGRLSQIGSKNLLHNWDFRNPVNQRGASSYTAYNAYTIDRWRIEMSGNGLVNIVSGGLQLQQTTGWVLIGQPLENPEKYINIELTLSAIIGGTLFSHTFNLTTAITNYTYALNSDWTFSISNQTGRVALMYFGTGSPVVSRTKLELGAISTLTNDPPADFGEQLAVCQRYYWRPDIGDGLGFQPSHYPVTTDAFRLQIYFPNTMRITPTLTLIAIRNGGSGSTITFSAYSVGITKSALALIYGITASEALSTTTPYQFDFSFSADL